MPSLNLRNPLRRDPNRPTLKQRAATLKATAARLIRKPKNTPSADADLCALAGPWEAACRLYDRRCEEQKAIDRAAMVHSSHPGPAPKGVGTEWHEWCRRSAEHRAQTDMDAAEAASTDALRDLGDIEDEIAALPARTLAGLQLKARVAERNSSVDVEWPQGLGDGLVADLLSLTGSLPAVPVEPQAAQTIAPEPVATDAEMIEIGRAFEAAVIRHREAYDAADAADHRASTRLAARIPDRPTIAGEPVTRSSLDGLKQAADEIGDEAGRGRARARLNEISVALDAYEADRARIFLEEGIEEKGAAAKAMRPELDAIARQAAALSAHTLDGVWVKVRIAAWYGVCDPTAPAEEEYPGDAAFRSLCRDTPRLVLDAETGDIRIEPEA